MLIDFGAFLAKLILALITLKLIELNLIRKNSDAPAGQAMAWLLG